MTVSATVYLILLEGIGNLINSRLYVTQYVTHVVVTQMSDSIEV